MAAWKGDKSHRRAAEQFDVHADQITERKRQLLSQAKEAFLCNAERKAAELGKAVGHSGLTQSKWCPEKPGRFRETKTVRIE